MPRPRLDRRASALIHDTTAIDREIFRRSFREYVQPAFEVVEAGAATAEAVRAGTHKPLFAPGWHIDAIADHLQAVADGDIRYLLVNVPPGTAKSIETCVLWPTWLWGRGEAEARQRLIFSSYSEEFTKRDTRKAKALMQSDWYRARFPHVVLKDAPDTMTEHHNTLGGERHGSSTNSGVTGKHVHGIVEDDPLKAQDAMSETSRELAWFYRTQVLSSRLLPEAGWRVLIMQRLHESDPSGRILADRTSERDGVNYTHLCLPMEFEPKRKCVTYIKRENTLNVTPEKPFFEDPRKDEGELLWPARMDAKFVAEKKSPVTGLGASGYAGQYQQRPAPAEGAIIKRSWLRYYDALPPDLEIWWQSWDLTFDKTEAGSYVVGQVWASKGANCYLVYQFRERVDFAVSIRQMLAVTKAYPMALKKKVEKKANGAALLSVLSASVPGLVAVEPRGDKVARLHAVSPLFEAGNVWLPQPTTVWASESTVEQYVEELVTFPGSAHNDQVDGTSQALADVQIAKLDGMNLNLEVGAQHSAWRDFEAGPRMGWRDFNPQ